MTMAVDKRQPRQTRGGGGGGRDSATDLVADKRWRRMRETAVMRKVTITADKRQWFGGGGRRRAARDGGGQQPLGAVRPQAVTAAGQI
jgi:hypothetical protein